MGREQGVSNASVCDALHLALAPPDSSFLIGCPTNTLISPLGG